MRIVLLGVTSSEVLHKNKVTLRKLHLFRWIVLDIHWAIIQTSPTRIMHRLAGDAHKKHLLTVQINRILFGGPAIRRLCTDYMAEVINTNCK